MIGTSNCKYISPHLVARHIPQSVSDLAVNVKKVEEVRHWLRDRLGKRGMLVLTGPAGDLLLIISSYYYFEGCGKTACVRALCGELGVHIEEWINPVEQV